LTQALFNDDERDTTEVPIQALSVLLDYLFIFYHNDKLAFNLFEINLYITCYNVYKGTLRIESFNQLIEIY